jgi:hypothetical protein
MHRILIFCCFLTLGLSLVSCKKDPEICVDCLEDLAFKQAVPDSTPYVLNVPSIFTSLGITLVAPFAITLPNDKTLGIIGELILLTICCKEIINFCLLLVSIID